MGYPVTPFLLLPLGMRGPGGTIAFLSPFFLPQVRKDSRTQAASCLLRQKVECEYLCDTNM